jgi:uncharacterized protein (TIGR03067 family)
MSTAIALLSMAGMLAGPNVKAADAKVAPAHVIPQDSKWTEKNKGWVWEFRKDGKLLTSYRDGSKDAPSRYVVRPTTNPAEIDIITIDGTSLGIYRLRGDVLEICWACPGTERPTKFTDNEPSSSLVLSTFKRVK